MKKLVTLLTVLMITLSMSAVPAKKKSFTHTQSNGQQISLMLVGDENLHYYLNTDTQEKMLQGENGDFFVVSEAQMASMKQTADARLKSANEARAKRLNTNRATTTTSSTTPQNGPRKVGDFAGMIGDKKGIVILVNYSDKSMATSHDNEAFDNMFNQEGYSQNGHIGSVHDYFYDQSYGLFNLTFDVVGPVTVSKKLSYYGSNNTYGNDSHPAEMVIEACKLADQAGVNFADYDWDGDGEVDQVFVIYAGYGEAQGAASNTIWPHEWELSSAAYYNDGTGAQTIDGVRINTYAVSCELAGTYGSTMNGIGTACHEFSHCLGYPDFYDTDYSGGIGMEYFDVMDAGSYNGPNSNGEVPCGFTSYERWVAGWLTPTELVAEVDNGLTIKDMPALNDTAQAYIMYNAKNANEYFLLENRQSKDWFKYIGGSTAGHGMLILHVDYSASSWAANTPNDDSSHQRMSWIAADKTKDANTGDFFPGTRNVTALTNTSHSSAGAKLFNKNTDGSYCMNHELTEITEKNGLISFLYDGGEIVDDGNRYTITYNAGTGSCETPSWTQTNFREKTTFPTATTACEGWEFIGWSLTEYAEASTIAPTDILTAGTEYQPMEDITFHAVYKMAEEGEEITSGSYTLDYAAETELQSTTLGYGTPVTYTAQDGSTWIVKAFKNNGMQINKGKNASIKVPECPGSITTIEVTGSQNKALKFSDTDYTGSNTPTAYATSPSAKEVTLDVTGADLTTGYIYTTEGATAIKKIVVNYGTLTTYYYFTYPDDSELVTPTIAFDEESVTMLLGDAPKTLTATVTDSEGAVSYSSSDKNVATIDPQTGEVTAVGVGTTTITAYVASVMGVSKSAKTTCELTVEMPALESIAVTTEPTKTVYWEGETFDKEGMVVTATYENGYTQEVADYTVEPSEALAVTDEAVIISYTEGEVTVTATVGIEVKALPRYTVTFDAGSGTIETESMTEEAYQAGVVLPSATGINENWQFAGWATESIAESMECPEMMAEGTVYMPTEDTTLYAVYTCNDYYASRPNGIDDLAGITDITIDALGNGKLYNLNGQRVSVPVRGQIYIQNGKKVVVR